MKKLLLFTISFSFFCTAKGQTTTAYDWTRTDCDGVNHHLFSELDQGNVIVIEFVMMDCVPCVTASKGIKDLVQPYETSHPGKVHIYGVAYTNSYTCEQLNTWKSENAFDYPVFTGGAEELSHYGSMGMPTIVIVGNSSHTVYYKKEGFAPSHEPQIKAAIDQALGISSGVDELNEETTRLFPNPAKDHITIETGTGSDRVLIRDMLGRVVLKEKVTADSRTIDLTALKKGFYTISVLKNGSVAGVKVFSKE